MKLTAITGSSTLANLFFGLTSYYAAASYYSWNQPSQQRPAGSGAENMLSTAHPLLIIAILLGFALLSSIPGMIVAYHTLHPQQRQQPTTLRLGPRRLDPRADADSGIVYKAKVVLTFTNETPRAIGVLTPRWVSGDDGVGLQTPISEGSYYYRQQVRGKQVELDRACIGPNETFALWVGLNPAVSDTELHQRLDARRLGRVIIPTTDGPECSFEV